jgi:hypothetical protein
LNPGVTVLSQQRRALNLVDAIIASAETVRSNGRVAIIGGGVSGMTATAAFAVGARGLQSIDLFEQLDKMLHLQVNSDRYLHPHLYDWPAAGATRADAGLPILDWSADEAGMVANRILGQFNMIRTQSNNLSVKTKRSVKAIEPLGDRGCRLVVEGAPAEGDVYDAAIIAVGFGYEKETSGENQSYWAPSRLTGPLRPYPRPELFISGNGDGGLVDFTMAAFNRMTHSQITAFLTTYEGLENTHQALLEIEERAWQDAEEKVDILAEYKSLQLPPHLLLNVYEQLRPDTEVWLHTKEPRLFRRKTAILNRFTTFLAIAADELRNRGLVHVCVGATIEGSLNHGAIKIGDTSITPLHRFLRFGPDSEANMRPFQTLSQKYRDAHPEKITGFRPAAPPLHESALLRFTAKSAGPVPETPKAEQIQPPEAPSQGEKHAMPQPTRDRVFISYSHEDKKWLEKPQTMLKPLVRKDSISVWDDTKIQPGANWKEEIEGALAAAKVAVLLVSSHFLGSDLIAEQQLMPLLESAKKDGLVILWVHLSSCLYDETEIKDYQGAHNILKPLDSLRAAQQLDVLADISRKIKAAVNP